MSTIRKVIGSDPRLTPLSHKVDNILTDYNRNVYKDLPNDQFIDHNKKRNQDCIVVADQTFSKDNRYPILSSTPEVGRTSTVKIYQNENQVMTRFDVDKEFQGDKVNVVQIRQAEPVLSSSKKRPNRTPAKQLVNVDQNTIVTNPDYDPNNMVRSYIHHEEAKASQSTTSDRRLIFANDTDPTSATKRRPQPVERLVVVQNVESTNVTPQKPPKDEPVMEKVIITSNDYHDPTPQAAPQPKPQPFQQYPVYEKLAIQPEFSYRDRVWEFSPYRARNMPPQFQQQTQPILERKVQEPAFEMRESFAGVALTPKLQPRTVKLTEVREISIQYPSQYFARQPTTNQIPIENGTPP